MSSTEQEPAAEQPSTDLELVQKVDWLRNQLAAVQAVAERAVAVRKVGPLDEWVNVLADYDQLAQTLARTSFVPKGFEGKPDQVTAVLMYGREIGLPPVTTLQNTYVVHGRVGMYAEQLRAMVLSAGHEYEIDEMNSDRCVVSGRRAGSTRWQQFTYTMDQAKAAGLYAQNDQYKKRPVEMLFARVTAIMCHAIFPDVLRGMSAVEEMEGAEGDQPDNAPVAPAAKATAQVGRKKAASKPAAQVTTGAGGTESAVAAVRAADYSGVSIPDESLPALPGEGVASPVSSAGSPGEGAATPDVATPAEPYLGNDPNQPIGEATDSSPVEYEPTTGGALLGDETAATGSPAIAHVPDRHCPDFDNQHPEHTWRTDDEGAWVEYHCQGVEQVQHAESAALDPSTVVPLSKAQTAMLQARFKQIGFTDEPDDREERLAVASRVVGREVETFRATDPGKGGMSKDEASRVIKALAPCRDKGAVVEMLAELAKARQTDG